MQYRTLVQLIKTVAVSPRAYLPSKKYIFIVSHMRAYTTLLSHILANNKDIAGYVENHLPYRSATDLYRLRYKLAKLYERHLTQGILLDKLLHNELTIGPGILARRDIFYIFLTRKPSETIPSIARMADRLQLRDLATLDDIIFGYYKPRQQFLLNLSQELKGRYFYIEGDQLMQETATVLDTLTKWLQLEEPLRPEYERFKMTGTKGIGDSSEFIHSGRIVRERHNQKISLSEVSSILEAQYVDAVNTLRANSCNNDRSPINSNPGGSPNRRKVA